MARSMCPGVRSLVLLCGFLAAVSPAAADEIWVAPTLQQDLGGLGIGSSFVWPVTAVGASRFAWGVPDNLQAFLSARMVLIPHAPGGTATLNVIVCAAQNGEPVAGTCAGPFTHAFTGVANRLIEIDITAELAGQIGVPGLNNLAVVAFTSPTTVTDHFAGLRFSYVPNAPTGVATLGANTFAGTQTAPMFVGDGTNVFNVNANLLDGLDSTAFAPTIHGHDVTQVTSAARLLGGNAFTGTQVIHTGNLELDASTTTTGNLLKNGTLFLHNAGAGNTFLGVTAGNLTLTGSQDTGIGTGALSSVTSAGNSTAVGAYALNSNTSGFANTATGTYALLFNTTGQINTANGYGSMVNNTTGGGNTAAGHNTLLNNTTGGDNTAIGGTALMQNTTGGGNTAVGVQALFNHGTGFNNIAVGLGAGANLETGSNNIYLGAIAGAADETSTMRLGGSQTRTMIAGVRGVTTDVPDAVPVVIDSNGQLGTSPAALAGLGANTYSGTQTAPAFAGDGSGLSNVNARRLEGFAASAFAAAVHGHDVSQIKGAATIVGGNTFGGTQTIDGGNLDLDDSTATTGSITKNGARFLHNFGFENTFVGASAGNVTMSGGANTIVGAGAFLSNLDGSYNAATGWRALRSNTTGVSNTASGSDAMYSNTTGSNNAVTGFQALYSNTAGHYNTAMGYQALGFNVEGGGNTAIGSSALGKNDYGHNNVAVGSYAGFNLWLGSNNIYLGTNVFGVAGESNTMYLGKVGVHAKTVIAGIRGTTTGAADAIPVVIDSNGQLGTISSSRRFKEDIHDMADASRRLYQLRPVTFRYKQQYHDGSKPINYGLVAEEVADVFPELAVRGADGEIETVHYETLNVLLLNELQQQQKELDATRQRVEKLEKDLEALRRTVR